MKVSAVACFFGWGIFVFPRDMLVGRNEADGVWSKDVRWLMTWGRGWLGGVLLWLD